MNIYRVWFYFRTGYNTYVAFLVGFTSNTVVIYELALRNNTFLHSLLPSLVLAALAAIGFIVPLSIALGLLHMKGNRAFSADTSVATELNPYNYKIIPGKEQKLSIPVTILGLKVQRRILEGMNLMSPELDNDFKHLERLLLRLASGDDLR